MTKSKIRKKAIKKGISKDLINEISGAKSEPKWMRDYRLAALEVFQASKLPTFGPSKELEKLDFDSLDYFVRPVDSDSGKPSKSWNDVPAEIKEKYEKLGIPEAEKRFLAGLGAQYESEMVYHAAKEELASQGVIFEEMSVAVQKYPDLVRKYFGKLIKPENNKFAALNGAAWSGGSFIYIPQGVYLDRPLHNFFQMQLPSQGQFERTVIVAEEGSSVEFIEGCVAPLHSAVSLHSGLVEIFVGKDADVKFSTMQNWSKNVWNLVTKRAQVQESGHLEWVDGNVGSGISMKYPGVDLVGRKASCRIFSLIFAGKGQIVDAGGKINHLASETSGIVESKSILRKGGRSSFRGSVTIGDDVKDCKSRVDCVALLLEEDSRADTYPTIKDSGENSEIEHESSILRLGEDQIQYLQSRGISENLAKSMIINGFVDPFTSELPMEYAVEFERLISLEIENGVG